MTINQPVSFLQLLINDSDTEEATFEEMFGTKPAIQTRRYHPPPIELGVPATDLTFHPKLYKLATADLDGEICLWVSWFMLNYWTYVLVGVIIKESNIFSILFI